MRNIWHIAMKDFKHFFSTPIGYIASAVYLFFIGNTFSRNFEVIAMQANNPGYQSMNIDLSDFIGQVCGSMGVIFLFVLPIFTMRLFAEEKRQRTYELLATSPVKYWEIVLGKYLSSVFCMGLILLITLIYPLCLYKYGTPPPQLLRVVLSYLAVMLIGGSMLSIGLFFSALTDSQIIAAILCFGTSFLLWMMGNMVNSMEPGKFESVLAHLSIVNHLLNLIRGLVTVKDIVYYVSVIVFFLFLTKQRLESESWR